MNPTIPRLLLPVGLTLSLAACASFPDFAAKQPEYDRLAQIHSGLTQDEVRDIAGKPDMVTGDSRPGGAALWIYDYNDEWGERSEFDVTFNPGGVVSDTYSEQRF